MGRLRDMEVLDQALLASVPAAVVVRGAAGAGKSRLVQEFSKVAERAGFQHAFGNCYGLRPAAPFLPVMQVLAQLGGSPSGTGGEWFDLRPADPPERRLSLFAALGDRILREGTLGKALLVVEELQWCDADSLLLLNHLLDLAGGQLRLLGTLRGDVKTAGSEGHLLARLLAKTTLHDLPALSDDDAANIVVAMCQPVALRAHEVAFLVNIAGGNPLFLTELVTHLRASGLLESADLPQIIASRGIPVSLRQLLDQRLQVLSSSALAVLQRASVVGAEFDLEAVEVASAVDGQQIQAALAEATHAGLIEAVDGPDPTCYVFAHPLLRENIYRTLPPETRRQAHRRLGLGLPTLSTEPLALHLAHGLEGEERSRAVAPCIQAAEHAEAILAFETAARFWRLALVCAPSGTSAERLRLLERLGLAYRASGDWQRAISTFRRALPIAEALGATETAARLAIALGEMHRFRLELQDSIDVLSEARALCAPRSSEEATALALLGSAFVARDEPTQGRPLIEEALEIAGSLGELPPAVGHWASLALSSLGDQRRSARLANVALDSARGRGDVLYVSMLAGTLAHIEVMNLRRARAEELVTLLESAPAPRDVASVTRTLLSRALLEAYAGNWQRVVRVCERWLGEVRLAGRFQQATARVIWAEAKAALGGLDDAVSAVEEVLPYLDTMESLAAMHLARLHLARGETDVAMTLVQKHRDDILRNERRQAARAVMADVVGSLGFSPDCEELHQILLNERRPLLVAYTPVSVQRVLGKLATAAGTWSAAFAHFEAAAESLTRGEATWELAVTLSDHAESRRRRAKRGDSLKAAALEAQAVVLFETLAIGPLRRESSNGASLVDRFGLTPRELEVLRLVARGLKNQEIAETLTLSPHTVDRHLENIFSKMSVAGRTQAVMTAVAQGLIALD